MLWWTKLVMTIFKLMLLREISSMTFFCTKKSIGSKGRKNSGQLRGIPIQNFFHASASIWKKSNHISYLKNDSGVDVSYHDGMYLLVNDYFFNVYAGEWNTFSTKNHNEDATNTTAQNVELIKELTFEEFSLAVSQMHLDKISGPNDLKPSFFLTLLVFNENRCIQVLLVVGVLVPNEFE